MPQASPSDTGPGISLSRNRSLQYRTDITYIVAIVQSVLHLLDEEAGCRIPEATAEGGSIVAMLRRQCSTLLCHMALMVAPLQTALLPWARSTVPSLHAAAMAESRSTAGDWQGASGAGFDAHLLPELLPRIQQSAAASAGREPFDPAAAVRSICLGHTTTPQLHASLASFVFDWPLLLQNAARCLPPALVCSLLSARPDMRPKDEYPPLSEDLVPLVDELAALLKVPGIHDSEEQTGDE
jgi:hypothetical protein